METTDPLYVGLHAIAGDVTARPVQMEGNVVAERGTKTFLDRAGTVLKEDNR